MEINAQSQFTAVKRAGYVTFLRSSKARTCIYAAWCPSAELLYMPVLSWHQRALSFSEDWRTDCSRPEKSLGARGSLPQSSLSHTLISPQFLSSLPLPLTLASVLSCFLVLHPIWPRLTGERHHTGDWASGKRRLLDFRWAFTATQWFQHLLIPALRIFQVFPSGLQLWALQYFTVWETNCPTFQKWSLPQISVLNVASFPVKMFILPPNFSLSLIWGGGGNPLSSPNQIIAPKQSRKKNIKRENTRS